MFKAIHAFEDKDAAREKASAVIGKLEAMKLREAAKKLKASIEEPLTYYDFPQPITCACVPITPWNRS